MDMMCTYGTKNSLQAESTKKHENLSSQRMNTRFVGFLSASGLE